jgi:multidrug efflux system membrane fusion protein
LCKAWDRSFRGDIKQCFDSRKPLLAGATTRVDDMRRWHFRGMALLAIGLAAFFYLRPRTQVGSPPARNAAVPVIAAEVKRADVPIFLNGIGTVQPSNSVVVKSRVDASILRIDFTEGENVRAGDVLVELDPAPFRAALVQTEATQMKDQAQLDNARLDFNRATRLATTGSGSTQQVDTTKALVAQLEASVKADQGLIDMAQIQLNYTTIRSPIDGRAGTRSVDVGNVVHANDTAGIVTINQLHPINVDFALPASSLTRIHSGMRGGEISVTVQDTDNLDLATGKLTVIDNQINQNTGTVRYKATFDNADEVLWPGQFVNVRVQLGISRQAITTPVTAVQQGPDGTYAFVVGKDRIIEKREIKIRLSNDQLAIIDSGLQPGEQVVIDGQYRIQAGSLVDVSLSPDALRQAEWSQ